VLATPYPIAHTARQDAALAAGVQLCGHAGLDLGLPDDFAGVTTDRIAVLVDGIGVRQFAEPDAVVLSCTAWPTLAAITMLEDHLGKPVLSSNLALAISAAGMDGRGGSMTTALASRTNARRLANFTARVARLNDVRLDVEANHDDNRWWPTSITDPRIRMLAAGWSTRISYHMIGTYRAVVSRADQYGFDQLTRLPDTVLADLVRPLGLPGSRIRYLRSLAAFVDRTEIVPDLATADADALIERFADEVDQAAYKVAQCAVLYARGYHCGVIPVDSGMITRLAPVLGLEVGSGPIAHEQMRRALQTAVNDDPDYYRKLAGDLGYQVTIPADAAPTWWLHLVLIYFKRHYLNRTHPQLCGNRPVCSRVLDCAHRSG
jgi:hypothetical protein